MTDILRDADLLPLYHKPGLLHIALGTEAAAQMKLDLFRKQTTIEQNKKAMEDRHGALEYVHAVAVRGAFRGTRRLCRNARRLEIQFRHPRS